MTPWRVAIDSEAGVALVTTYQRHDTVAIVDTTRRELVATIPVGDQPTEIAIDTSSHVAYILNTSDNTVSIIDIGKRTATATIGVGKKPQNLAVDPSTHTAYVTNAGDGTRLDHRALKQPNGTGPRHGPG
ncbi:YncE family protein [Nocardia sp. NBC_01009]|uniref:YncE family protein n=1 Tax=Nocardia sp. NBC_01009 TaxID=2975996 RepID=UPI003870B50C|nr:hypothetical protein OHA42_25145 [Nocardia sp. NBC_01009]